MRPFCVAIAVVIAVAAGCQNEKSGSDETASAKLPRVEGLDAVPGNVSIVAGVDVAKLADSVLVARAVQQMWDRDPELEKLIDGFIDACKVNPTKDVSSLVIAMGDSDDVVMVATGRFVESEITVCIEKALSADGGRLTTADAGGRALYRADAGADKESVWFAFGSDDTFLVSSSEPFLKSALADGPKASSDKKLAGLIAKARKNGAAIWAAGAVPPQIGRGLESASGGAVKAPSAMFGHVQLSDGFGAELGAVMASADEANTLVSFGKKQMKFLALAAAKKRLTPFVDKLVLEAADSMVILSVELNHDELRDLLSRIDTDAADEQNPSLDAGTGVSSDDQGDAAPGGKAPVRQ